MKSELWDLNNFFYGAPLLTLLVGFSLGIYFGLIEILKNPVINTLYILGGIIVIALCFVVGYAYKKFIGG